MSKPWEAPVQHGLDYQKKLFIFFPVYVSIARSCPHPTLCHHWCVFNMQYADYTLAAGLTLPSPPQTDCLPPLTTFALAVCRYCITWMKLKTNEQYFFHFFCTTTSIWIWLEKLRFICNEHMCGVCVGWRRICSLMDAHRGIFASAAFYTHKQRKKKLLPNQRGMQWHGMAIIPAVFPEQPWQENCLH